MKNLILFLFVIISFSTYSQKLNRLGKIVLDEIPQAPEFWRIKNGTSYNIIYKDTLTFEGNEFYKLPNAFVANDETADEKPDKINYYGSNGKLVVSIITPRIINFKTSVNGSFAAFYNRENILLVDLNTFHIDTLFGSHSFAFTNDEKLIYYDAQEKIIVYENQVYSCEEFPKMFIDYNSNILVFTSSRILKFSGTDFITLKEFEGEFYDARIIDNILYFVDKKQKRKDPVFTLYKTSDLINFEIIEKSDYK